MYVFFMIYIRIKKFKALLSEVSEEGRLSLIQQNKMFSPQK